MKSLSFQLLLFLTVPLLLLTSCDDDDPVIENDEELITTLIYTLSPTGGGSDRIFTFVDLDGDGGNPPTILSDTLMANTTYVGTLELYNEAEAPREDIAAEIKAEDKEHQLFFTVAGTNLTIEYADEDANGNPIGLTTDATTGDADSGTLTITLRHEPDKTASGVADGDLTNAGGTTDIQVTFSVIIQ